ncbi:hypothetical protein AAF712_005478 [Marasmius tenuissimus]|uniref:PARP-type domain-containing protein n=1 Tax=Marasmius tenuissimus TaxID=585030 RepID=A0ABR3A390_9AGAR
MSTSKPTSPATGETIPPKFSLEYAAAARSKCRHCNQRIDRGAFRLGIATTANGRESYGYRHWGCVKPEELLEIQKLDLGKVSKYDELHEDDKIRLSKAVEAGHISEEDRLDQTAKSNKAAEEQKELKEGKGKEKQDETEKRERKKSKKRKEIEDEADKAAETEPKAKKQKAEQVAPKAAEAPAKERKSPRKSKTLADVVPDSEDDEPIALKKPAGKPVKKPRVDGKDSSKSKEKSSPKKSKDTGSTTSPAKGDDTMDVDDDDAQEVADALKAKSQTKETDKDKKQADKPTKQPTKANMKAVEDQSGASPTAKAIPKETPKALSKATTSKAPAKDPVAPSSKAAKSKPTDAKVEKPVNEADTQNSDPDAESSDKAGPSTPQGHSPIYLNLADLLSKPSPVAAAAAETSTPRPRPPPRLPLGKFCKQYKLSSSLHEKLSKLDIDGPHVLRLIKDKDQGGGFVSDNRQRERLADRSPVRDIRYRMKTTPSSRPATCKRDANVPNHLPKDDPLATSIVLTAGSPGQLGMTLWEIANRCESSDGQVCSMTCAPYGGTASDCKGEVHRGWDHAVTLSALLGDEMLRSQVLLGDTALVLETACD